DTGGEHGESRPSAPAEHLNSLPDGFDPSAMRNLFLRNMYLMKFARACALADEDLAELTRFLAIPSISADPAHAPAVAEAAEWVAAYVRWAGGTAEVVDWNGSPLVDAVVPASTGRTDAPTVLCYGHFDVQPPAPLEQWPSDPFVAALDDGWLVARGVA